MNIELLQKMHAAAIELAQYASYAEIVGGISQNRKQIREWCDKVLAIHNEIENADTAGDAIGTSDVLASMIGADEADIARGKAEAANEPVEEADLSYEDVLKKLNEKLDEPLPKLVIKS